MLFDNEGELLHDFFKEIKVIVRDKSADSEGIRWELYSDLIESLWLLCLVFKVPIFRAGVSLHPYR